jgi:hypothetical protein
MYNQMQLNTLDVGMPYNDARFQWEALAKHCPSHSLSCIGCHHNLLLVKLENGEKQ